MSTPLGLTGVGKVLGSTFSQASATLLSAATTPPPAGTRGVIISPAPNTSITVVFNGEKVASPVTSGGHSLPAGAVLRHYGPEDEIKKIWVSGACQLTYLGKD